jgi:hypothetical protein
VSENVQKKLNYVRKWADNVSAAPVVARMKRFIGIQLAVSRFRKVKEQEHDFTNFFSDAHYALIILPRNYDAASVAGKYLPLLREKLAKMELTFIDPRGALRAFTGDFFYETLSYNEIELSQFGIPKEELLRRITKNNKKKYDIAIDLNLEFDIASAYICRASYAPVRVGFAHRHADAFYNVLLRFSMPKEKLDAKQLDRFRATRYEQLTQCLNMF